MDLRSVLNTSDNGDRAPPNKAPPTPQQQPRPSPYGYREYAQPPPHPSPGKPMAPDYAHPPHPAHPPHHPHPPHLQQHHAAGAYPNAAPSPYQQPPGPYPGRAAPPPLQPANTHPSSFHDVRSPGSMSAPPVQSPYRPTPTPTSAPGAGPAAAGYPFPPAQSPQEMTSPSQRHQYPPGHYQPQHQRRDSSFSQAVAAHGPGAYVQQQQQQQHSASVGSLPQTPPIATPGGPPHPYLHQRSQSAQSTPTSTSAHSQHQFGPPHVHGSPIAAAQPPPPPLPPPPPPLPSQSAAVLGPAGAGAEFGRQLSQPPTSLGQPQPTAPRPSATFTQPPSPYLQQRMSSTGSAQSVQQQASPTHPPPPLPAAVQRMSSAHSHGAYDSSSASDAHSRPRSHHEREASLSVSPRTRVASLASNAAPDAERRTASAVSAASAAIARTMAVDADSAVTPAKRKLDDRSLSPRELEPREPRPPPGEANGGYAATAPAPKPASPVAAPKKRRVHRAQPPVWAQSAHSLGNKMPTHANFVLQKRPQAHINGKHDGSQRASRNASPEASRAQQQQQQQQQQQPQQQQHGGANHQGHHQHHAAAAEPGPQELLGPWEASIAGVKPYEEISKTVADFIFIHVVNNCDLKEISSRGIQFEIEAKLGTLIDKDTNYRVDRLLDTECILHDTGRVAFKSSMTEAHHKAFNDFLNHVVIQTDPRAPNGAKRVQVHYKHRREVDRFFELPTELLNRLPGCMRSRLGPRGRGVRVRVTHDQKTREVLNKIVKARVADIDLHMPSCPMDCRLSINLEMTWDGSVEELEQLAASQADSRQPDRSKDRLSYTQGHYQIDLTQVTQTTQGPGNSQRVEKEHELEIELAPGIVMDQGAKAMNGAPHRYQELIEGLLDNVRVLARKAREFP